MSIRKKATTILTLVLGIALSGMLLTACSSAQDSDHAGNHGEAQQTAFNLGHLNSTAHVLAFVAKEEGYFEDDSADVKLVYFDSQKDAYAALASPEIDAASCYSPYTAIAVADGYSIVYRCSDEEIFENQPCCRQVALTTALNANPDKYEAFERALIRAYAFFKSDHDRTVADVKKYIDIPDDQIEFELYEGYADSSPDPDKIATTQLKNDAVAFGYTTDYNIDDYYNTTIYAAALEDLIAADPNNSIYQDLREHFEQAD